MAREKKKIATGPPAMENASSDTPIVFTMGVQFALTDARHDERNAVTQRG
jgi:hypothetical protein